METTNVEFNGKVAESLSYEQIEEAMSLIYITLITRAEHWETSKRVIDTYIKGWNRPPIVSIKEDKENGND